MWVAETDPWAAAVLETRFAVPNLGDIRQVDWTAVTPVDTLCAGFPCQDISHAGLGAGIKEGNRSGLWFDVAAAVRVLRPRRVVIENVGAIRNRGLDIVTYDLAALGYVGSWVGIRANAVGACHRRLRIFIVATDPAQSRREGSGRVEEPSAGRVARRPRSPANTPSERRRSGAGPGDHRSTQLGWPRSRDDGRTAPPDADRYRRERQPHVHADQGRLGTEPSWRGHAHRRPRPDLGIYEPAVRRWEELTRPAPDPRDVRGRLNQWFVEWMMGLPEGWVCDVVSRRTDALRILGNGVVPAQAAHGVALAERILADA